MPTNVDSDDGALEPAIALEELVAAAEMEATTISRRYSSRGIPLTSLNSSTSSIDRSSEPKRSARFGPTTVLVSSG